MKIQFKRNELTMLETKGNETLVETKRNETIAETK